MDRIAAKHILVTGGGAPGAYGIIKALQLSSPIKISSCDLREQVIGKELADGFFTLPAGDHPDYIPALMSACKEHSIDTILPITTRELTPISAQKEALEQQGIIAIVSAHEALNVANDKGKLIQHLEACGIRVPSYSLVENWQAMQKALKPYFEAKRAVVVKPAVANGSRGVRIIDPQRDAWEAYQNDKPSSLYISSQELTALFEGRQFPPTLVMDYMDGLEYSVDCLVEDGKPLLIIPRKRLKINNGISVEGVVEQNREVIAYCRDILKSLKLHGPIGVQVKYKDGQPYILEINPRLQGTSNALVGAGINLPQLAIDQRNGEVIESQDIEKRIKWGTRFIRHYQEYFIP
jgi:carbamoyl-phosphate synthase large subunit